MAVLCCSMGIETLILLMHWYHPIHVRMYTYVVSTHAPPFSCKLLLDECVLAMDTYHKQEIVALFCAEYVAVALNVP